MGASLSSLQDSRRTAWRLARRAVGLGGGLLALAVALGACGTPVRLPLDGPGLHRTVAQDGQGALHFWWLPPNSQVSHARLLLWDGANVAVGNPSATDQSFTPLGNGLVCNQVALAPDDHAFACGLVAKKAGAVLLQSLDNVQEQPEAMLDESAPLAWSPDSQTLAGLRQNLSGAGGTCSVVATDTSLPDTGEEAEQVLLDGIPFAMLTGKGISACPVTALAWSPDGARLALSLAASNGVVLEVLRLGAKQEPPTIESRLLLPGQSLKSLDTLAAPSLFWSPDGQMLAALTGYESGAEDRLFLLPAGGQTPLSGPNLIDTGSGAALAWSPDGRWLAAGVVGPIKAGENAQLQVFDAQSLRWGGLSSMFVNGPTLAWSVDGAILAAASVSRQGLALWDWPKARLSKVVPNRDIASVEQLDWAQDGSALLFTVGSSDAAPTYDEVYTQAFPIPSGGASSFAFPTWFLSLLTLTPQGLIGLGIALLVIITLAVALALRELGRPQGGRTFTGWTLGVAVLFLCFVILGYNRIPEWLARLYQLSSEYLCQGAPNPCNPGAILATSAPGAALLAGLLAIIGGTLMSGGKRRPVLSKRPPKPTQRPALRQFRSRPGGASQAPQSLRAPSPRAAGMVKDQRANDRLALPPASEARFRWKPTNEDEPR